MAQAVGLSGKDGKIEYSPTGLAGSWVDISGWGNSWGIDGGARKLGEAYTFDGDGPAVAPGKHERFTIALSFLYTEGASDPAKTLWDAYDQTTAYYLRISPTGGGPGEFIYTTGPGYFLNPPIPAGDASSEDLLVVETEFNCGTLTRTAGA